MESVFQIIWYVLFSFCFFFSCYHVFLALVGMVFHTQKYPLVEDQMKFCIFVPCHNEEAVIGATVGNLSKINYTPEFFDIYFIADNCSDQTAERIRKSIYSLNILNFHVWERNVTDPSKKGKPHAMRWGIDRLEAENRFYESYDMFMILDADNFVDPDILKHMNSQYLHYKEKKRPVMIQAYLDSKNKNSLVARGYFASYRLTNGFFQLSRHKLGLVPAIGGTGFAVTTCFLKEIGGYNCQSLTEDLEFQAIATLHGKTIAYNHNVRIYDEKPTGIVQSAVQRTRWSQGHWYIYFKYTWRILLRMFNPKEIKSFFKRFDMLVYLASMFFLILSVLYMVYSGAMLLFEVAIPSFEWMRVFSWMGIFTILLFPISSLYDGPRKEKHWILIDFIPNMIANFLVALICIYADVVGLFKCGNQKVWVKTKHKVTAITYAMEDGASEETPVIADAASENLISEPSAEEVTLEASEASSPESAVELNV